MNPETENKILKEALQRFAGLISGVAIQTDITEYKIKGSDIYAAQQALALTEQRSGVDGFIKTIGDLIDSAVPEGNGDSIVPTYLIEDLREVMFGVRGEIDE